MWRLALLLCPSILLAKAELSGIGVCTKQTTISEPVTQRAYVSKIVYYTYRCWAIRICRGSRALFDWQVTTKYINKQVLDQFCCEGYVLGSGGSVCSPVCEPSCEHGQCVAPQRCACDPGYRRANSPHSCDPVCDPPCRHGQCEAPNLCRCDRGYRITSNSSVCEPVCSVDCSHGKCVSPEECVCDPGFTKDSGNKCTPRCSKGCTHGVCSSPEKCDCLPGYRNKESLESNGCEPVCDFSCTNGICSAPNVCTCDEGYGFKVDKCAPICDKECKNGICSGPNTCSCNEGYNLDSKDQFSCNAVCNNSCGNGICVAPNTCICNEGYKLSSKGTCEAYCSNGCNNGVCTQPEKCSCNPGYVDVPVSFDDNCKQFCAANCGEENECVPNGDGIGCDCSQNYNRTMTNQCVPFCSKGCENGECVGPEKCACAEGYEKDLGKSHICRPVCSKECEFGDCVQPNICACKNGYAPSENPFKCSPTCSETCLNAKCVAPNTCECVLGFKRHENESNVCVTDCSLHCENGFCIGSDICQCNSGYVKSALDHICVPFCEGCSNGSCIAPGLCFCHSGFENPPGNSQACVPRCENGCENGICSAPDTCSCLPGYHNYQSDENVCNAECSRTCLNGNCTLPEICECFPGYRKDPDNWNICLPVCSEGCVNGICSAPENCSCLWGFSSEFESSNCNIIDASNLTNSWTFRITSTAFDEIPQLVSNKIKSLRIHNSFFLKNIIKMIKIGDYLEVYCADDSVVTNNDHNMYRNSTALSYSCSLSKQSIDEFQHEEIVHGIIEITETAITQSESEETDSETETAITQSESEESDSESKTALTKSESEETESETEVGITDWIGDTTTATELQAIILTVTLDVRSFIVKEKITPEYFDEIQALPHEEEFHLCQMRNTRSWSEEEILRFYLCKKESLKSYKPTGLVLKPFVLAMLVSFGVYFSVFAITAIIYLSKSKKSVEISSLDDVDSPSSPNAVFMTPHNHVPKTSGEVAGITNVIMLQRNQGSTNV